MQIVRDNYVKSAVQAMTKKIYFEEPNGKMRNREFSLHLFFCHSANYQGYLVSQGNFVSVFSDIIIPDYYGCSKNQNCNNSNSEKIWNNTDNVFYTVIQFKQEFFHMIIRWKTGSKFIFVLTDEFFYIVFVMHSTLI